MKNIIVLGENIQFDDYVAYFVRDNIKHARIISIKYHVYDVFGTNVIYDYSQGITLDVKKEAYATAVFTNHPEALGLRSTMIDIHEDKYCVYVVEVLNPVSLSKELIGSMEIIVELSDHNKEAYRALDDFDYHYFEHMTHHFQMVLVNYEKLYYVIDVFTELFISKDKFIPYHMTNVANWCMLLAPELGLSQKDQMVLYVAALIHDIGKLFIADNVLNKPGKLSDDEYSKMKMHPIKSYQMAQASLFGMTFFKEVPIIIKHHHERFDGKGYPNSLKGAQIPLLSRIIGVADTVDAMMSRRAYKDSETTEKIIKELAVCSGTQFDPIIANHMINLLTDMNTRQGETMVADTYYVPQAALSFYYKDVHHMYSFAGNLIIKENEGKLLIHDDLDLVHSLDEEHIHRATISYYRLQDLLEYTVDVSAIVNDQVFLENFKAIPTDKYFSLVWDSGVVIENHYFGMYNVQMLKLGGDTIVFEAEGDHARDIMKYRGELLKIHLDLEVDQQKFYMVLDAKVVKYYNFGNKMSFLCRFINISTSERDRILRVLFRRQMLQKQSRKSAANRG